MERNDRHYGDRSRGYNKDNRNEQFENYRDRYSNRGNYYGMQDAGHEYRNVRSTGSTGSSSSGPMQSGRHDDYRAGHSDSYHYGDPNPYMGNSRNRDYGSGSEFGWRSERDTRHSRGNNFGDRDRYGRQDNSYRYSGEGRHYNEFARDENRTDDRYRSYNAGTADHYVDRGPIREGREDNDYGRKNMQYGESPYYEGTYDDSDFRYSGEIRSSRNRSDDDNYATGLYASNRAYVSDHRNRAGSSDGDRVSSRERRYGRSGPDYGSSSGVSSYGSESPRA